jgi:Putative peptidoglycan binding domain
MKLCRYVPACVVIVALIAISSSAAAEPAQRHDDSPIRGLDGELYEPYNRVTIERTQRSLRGRGLYPGPVNGILDTPTMQAIYAFQKASSHLQMCGVPTPRTRMMLEQGSHTDLASPIR